MAPFVARGTAIAIASEDSILVTDTVTGVSKNVSIPPIQQEQNTKTEQDENQMNKQVENPTQKSCGNTEDYSHLNRGTCLAISQCASLLAACTPDKNLTVWKLPGLELVKQWKTARKTSSLTFSSDNSQLFVADKSGDCYSYSLEKPDVNGNLILGHVSMLLSVVVSDDGKFIITSERDEKIRISCLPNAYNIHAFCLGHTEFVTSLSFLKENLLLSGSGDGSIRLWNYFDGRVLGVESMKEPSDEEMEKAVRSLVTYKASSNTFIAAVLLDRVQNIFLFKITTDGEPTFHRQTLPFISQPLEAAFTEEGSLYVLTDSSTNPIEFFVKDASFQYTLGESAVVSSLLATVNHLKIIQDSAHSCNGDLKPLFKRWFDNVQLFRERKPDLQKRHTQSANAEITSPKRLRVE